MLGNTTLRAVALSALLGLIGLTACVDDGSLDLDTVEGELELPPPTNVTATAISPTLIDVASKRVVATLPTGQGAHEVAVSRDGRWAVVSNYGVRGAPGNSLTVIDVASATVARTIDLGEYRRPHGSTFLPGDSLMAITSEASKAIVLVDFKRGTVVGTIPTNHPASHMLAVTADGTRGFTSNIADGTVSELDIAGRKFVRELTAAPAVEGIAVTPSGDQVWAGSNQQKSVTVIDTKAGKTVATLTGFGLPYRLAITLVLSGSRAVQARRGLPVGFFKNLPPSNANTSADWSGG